MFETAKSRWNCETFFHTDCRGALHRLASWPSPETLEVKSTCIAWKYYQNETFSLDTERALLAASPSVNRLCAFSLASWIEIAFRSDAKNNFNSSLWQLNLTLLWISPARSSSSCGMTDSSGTLFTFLVGRVDDFRNIKMDVASSPAFVFRVRCDVRASTMLRPLRHGWGWSSLKNPLTNMRMRWMTWLRVDLPYGRLMSPVVLNYL